MRNSAFVVIGLVVASCLVAPAAMAQVEGAPVPDVPVIYTINGQFSRISYNNEGWVTLGYRTANASQGTDWMLLEAGVTIRKPHPAQTLTRAAFSIKMPDGSYVPMATQKEYNQAGYLRALNARGNTVRDSINYFPIEANQACAMRFFSDPTNVGSISYDQFELNRQRACVGRIFFKLPEGQTIEPGQYWLSVKFANSVVEAPFRIMTKEEEKFLKKNWKDLKKEHEAFIKSELEKAKQEQEQQQ
jgi:hypothetical protein